MTEMMLPRSKTRPKKYNKNCNLWPCRFVAGKRGAFQLLQIQMARWKTGRGSRATRTFSRRSSPPAFTCSTKRCTWLRPRNTPSSRPSAFASTWWTQRGPTSTSCSKKNCHGLTKSSARFSTSPSSETCRPIHSTPSLRSQRTSTPQTGQNQWRLVAIKTFTLRYLCVNQSLLYYGITKKFANC